MLMPQNRWEEFRDWFTDEERAALNLATTGESMTPHGVFIDLAQLTPALREKLALHFGRTMRAGDMPEIYSND